MSSTRTQIYLTSDMRRQIDEVATARGVSLAQIVREALDEYLADHSADPTAALEATFGADPAIDTPSRETWARA
jgi:hypothetical protein